MRRKVLTSNSVRFFAGLRKEITYDAAWDNYSQEVRYDLSKDPETPEFSNLLPQLLKEENPSIAAAIQILIKAKDMNYAFPFFQLYALMCRVEAMEARMKDESITDTSEHHMLILLKEMVNVELRKQTDSFSPRI